MITSFFSRLSPIQRSFLSATAGFLFYGTWAFSVNYAHGMAPAIKAACVQGSYSFLLTFVMTQFIERLFLFFFNLINSLTLVIWTTIIVTCISIFSTSWGVNYLAGTPEIFKTVILGYIIGGTSTIVYVYGLGNARRKAY